MKILILGASSYVGARLYVDLKQKFDVVGTYAGTKLSDDFVQLDITDADAVKLLVRKQKPEYIVHVANSANARWCDEHPEEAQALNMASTQTVVDAANEVGARLIFISSFAAIYPINTYGDMKRKSEEVVKRTKAGWVILRPSLIVGYSPNTTNDRPFNRILKNLDEGTEPAYDTSWRFQPTSLEHLSLVTLQVIDKEIVNDTIEIAVPELATRFDLARDILEPFGIRATEIDQQDKSIPFQSDLAALTQYDLARYSYQEMIDGIVEEIRNRKRKKSLLITSLAKK
jgi:dTDP-4-dehydrorhamnose reductase